MRGMRNHIAHSYNEIEFAVVWDTLERDHFRLTRSQHL